MSFPTPAEVEHADWPALVRMAEDLGLNPKGRSGVVRLRVMDHMRRRTRPEPWRPRGEHLAPLLTRLGHPDAATRLWEAAMRLDAPAPWVGYGAARLASGELEEARKAYDRAVQMGDAVAHLHKAELLAARGDVLGAVRACDAYLEEMPEDLRALALRAGFLARGGSVDEAIETLRRAADAHADVGIAWRGLGFLLLRSGRAQDAAHALRAATQRAGDDGDALVLRGTALLLAGRTKDAIGVFRESLEHDADRADALNNLGVAYIAAGSAKSGLVTIERAARRLEAPQILRNLARTKELVLRRKDVVRTRVRVRRRPVKKPEPAPSRTPPPKPRPATRVRRARPRRKPAPRTRPTRRTKRRTKVRSRRRPTRRRRRSRGR